MTTPAIVLAMDFARLPAIGSAIRHQRIPDDILTVIKVAADDAEALRSAVALTRAHPRAVHDAAARYLEYALFYPGADHYRVLGVPRDASRDSIREHMRWLLLWLHPDRNQDPPGNGFVDRVLTAWHALGTAERREAYDRTLAPTPALRRWPVRRGPFGSGPGRWVAIPHPTRQPRRSRPAFLALAIVVAAALLTLLWLPGPNGGGDDSAASSVFPERGGGATGGAELVTATTP